MAYLADKLGFETALDNQQDSVKQQGSKQGMDDQYPEYHPASESSREALQSFELAHKTPRDFNPACCLSCVAHIKVTEPGVSSSCLTRSSIFSYAGGRWPPSRNTLESSCRSYSVLDMKIIFCRKTSVISGSLTFRTGRIRTPFIMS